MDARPLPRQGDVLRIPECGPFKADEGSDLVVLFLGACEINLTPDVPAYLAKLGFQRTHLFEVTLDLYDGGVEPDDEQTAWTERHVFPAKSPRDAVEQAVRFAKFREGSANADTFRLELCLMRLGPVGPSGKPHNGRGQTFARWGAASGKPIESLLDAAGP